jgi:hypothetical protein
MKNLKLAFVFLFIVGFGLIAVGCQEVSAAEDAYVTIDINPSIELIVTPKEKVIYANPLNEDGELLLLNLDLIGLQVSEAIELILDESINLGFIDPDAEETLVEINTISVNAQVKDQIQAKVKEKVNEGFQNRAIVGRAEDKGFTPEFLAEAESYGVTPGFLMLAKSAVEFDDTITLEDALLMTQQELMTIVRDGRAENREMRHQLREDFHAARELIFEEYHPQILALREDIAELEVLIELGEGDLEAYQTELDAKNVELETLVAELRAEMDALREEFQAENDAIKAQEMIQHQMRIQENRDKVEAYRAEMQERMQERKDAINDFQKGGSNRP